MDVVVDVKEGADRSVQRGRGLQLGRQPALQRRASRRTTSSAAASAWWPTSTSAPSAATSSSPSPSPTSATRRSPSASTPSAGASPSTTSIAPGRARASRLTYPVTAFGCESLWGLPLDDGPGRRRLPHRAGGDRRHRLRRHRSTSAEEGNEPDQQRHAARLAQHAEPRLRPDGRLVPGALGRGRRPRAASSSSRSRRADAGTTRSCAPSASVTSPTRWRRLAGYGVGETGVTATSCRSSSATSRAASTRFAASRPGRLGPARAPQEHPRRRRRHAPDRWQLAAHPQQRDHLPAGAGRSA